MPSTSSLSDNEYVVIESDRNATGVGDTIFKTGGVERARITANGTATGLLAPAVAFQLTSDGTTVTAYNKSGATVSVGADGGAVLAAVLPAAASAGATISFRNDGNVFPWASVPGLPSGVTNKLLIVGNGVTVQLSAAGPRFLDFAKVADYDTFQNIEINGFVVDVNNVGGQHHVVLGTYRGGSNQTRLNFLNLTVRNIRTVNVPVDSTLTNHRLNIYIDSQHLAAGEATQTSLKNILIEDVRFEGGNAGVALRGSNQTSGTANNVNVNVVGDNLTVRRMWHSLLAAQPSGFSSENIQIGQAMKVNRCLVQDCYGQFSGDVGIEVDNAVNSVVSDSLIEDAFNEAYLFTNFNNPLNADEQHAKFVRCAGRRTVGTAGIMFKLTRTNSLDFAWVTLTDCTWFRNTADMSNNAEAIQTQSSPNVQRFVVERVQSTVEGATNGASNFTPVVFSFAFGTAATNRLIVRDCGSIYTGSKGAGTLTWVGAQVLGTCSMDIDGLDFNTNISSVVAGNTRCLSLGAATSILRGTIRRLVIVATASDTSAQAIRLAGSATLTITDLLSITDCDFSQLPAGGSGIVYVATSVAPAVSVSGNRWQTRPAPSALTGLVTATGAKLSTGYPVIVQFAPGSGAAITAIDYSTNGGTTYTNLLTQASAAMPASPTLIAPGPLSSDTLIKVTFTTTQPTITLVPVNP